MKSRKKSVWRKRGNCKLCGEPSMRYSDGILFSVEADSDLDEFTVSFSNSFVSQRCLVEWLY